MMFSLRMVIRAAFCVAFLLALALPSSSSNAQGDDGKLTGAVWASVFYGDCPSEQICPNVAAQLPGGGQGIISSGIEWAWLWADGIGRTEVQGTVYSWEISAYTQLYQNHSPVAYAGWNSKWSSGSSDSIDARARSYGNPSGAYWSNEAAGKIHNPSLMTWQDSVIVGVQL